jgi:hypothetical protein
VSLQLHAFKDEPPFDLNFNYRSAVGKLNYLAQTARPGIMYAMHQIAKSLSDPRQSHGEAILNLVCYLKKMHSLGLKFKPESKKGFECYCDMNFSGNWNRNLHPWIPVLLGHEAGGSSSMQDALSSGPPNFNLKLRYLPLRPSTWPCRKHYLCH